MPLTPSDIEQKTFATAFKGYDLAEVDDFLDEVIATIRDLEEAVAKGGSAPATVPPVADESAVGRALVAAQTAADSIIAEAREEAERIKAEARAEADSWESDKAAKKAEAEAAISALGERVGGVRRELALLVATLADGVEEMETAVEQAEEFISSGEDLDGSSEDDFDLEDTDIEDNFGSVANSDSDASDASDDSDGSGDTDSAEDDDDFEAWELDDDEIEQSDV